MTQALPNLPQPTQGQPVPGVQGPAARAGLQAPLPLPPSALQQPRREADEGIVDAGELEYASWMTPGPH